MAALATELRQQALALYRQQRLLEADALLDQATGSAPDDPATAFLRAQVRYELGYPASAMFMRALTLWPENPEVRRNVALALQSEGQAQAAREFLERALDADPSWLAGHHALAALLWTSGDALHFTDRLAGAARSVRHDPSLWSAWFQLHAQARQWDEARLALEQAESALGQTRATRAQRLFLACEHGSAAEADALITTTSDLAGDGVALCRIRHALRQGDSAGAEAIALPLTATSSAAVFWPYLSLAWRLAGDSRAEWLDAPDRLIGVQDDILNAVELEELADLLRSLHLSQAPYLEQSVRGGTQTDRSLLLRCEPELQRLRIRLLDAIRSYIEDLPAPDPAHPLLSVPRKGSLLVEGSWSVRLLRQGYNVPHTHPRGWLSTAFYVALPDEARMGPAPAGHIQFGAPPPELGLALEPWHTVAPKPGRMAIFPSTTWHGTVPFEDGERLIVAFDVRKP
jgi:tetratricopeptide (TPR) repeat protein